MGPPSSHPTPLHYESRPVREYQFLSEQPERLEENQYYERPTPLNLFPAPDRTLELLQQSRVCIFDSFNISLALEGQFLVGWGLGLVSSA